MDDHRDPIHLHHPGAAMQRRVRVAAAVVRRGESLLLTQRDAIDQEEHLVPLQGVDELHLLQIVAGERDLHIQFV